MQYFITTFVFNFFQANEIRTQLKNLDATSNRMTSHYNKAQNEINDTFQYYTTLLEERKVCKQTAAIGHSSEIRGLCLMKLSSEMLQNLPNFWNKKTQA